MGKPPGPERAISDEQFIAAWTETPSPTAIAEKLGIPVRTAFKYRRTIEHRNQIILRAGTQRPQTYLPTTGLQIDLKKFSGIIFIWGDAHFWPQEKPSTSWEALLTLTKKLKPDVHILNGDAFDGARVSRFGSVNWDYRPSVHAELDVCQERLAEIETEVGRGVPLLWNMGNHDERFGKCLAQSVPEMEGVHGMSLSDHFPKWQFSYSTLINKSLMVKHRHRGGKHATWNNILEGQISVVTNHLHRGAITSLKGYGPRIWGVDPGCISAFGPAEFKFAYAENAPVNWTQGFAVLTINKDRFLQPPELCTVEDDGRAYFRGHPV